MCFDLRNELRWRDAIDEKFDEIVLLMDMPSDYPDDEPCVLTWETYCVWRDSLEEIRQWALEIGEYLDQKSEEACEPGSFELATT